MGALARVLSSALGRRRAAGALVEESPHGVSGVRVPSGHEVVCRVADIPDGGVIGVDFHHFSPLPLILWRRGEAVNAWLNCCPADGYRMDWTPGRFLVKGAVLTCANRGARFALDQAGLGIGGPCRGQSLVPVPTRIEDGLVTLTEAPPVIEPQSH